MHGTISEFAESLPRRGMAKPGTVVGCTPAEVEEVRADQGVARLPDQYAEFLLRMGRGAGTLLVGTDFFYPSVLGLGVDGREFLEENDAARLEPSGAVAWYRECERTVFQSWPSLFDFLLDELREERRLLGMS